MDEDEIKRQVRIVGPNQRAYAVRKVFLAPLGWIATVRPPTRTNEQNAMLHPLLRDLSKQVAWQVNGVVQKITPDDWKDIATASLTKEQRLAAGMDGGFVFLGRRTSTMSKQTFSDLLEIILAFGSSRGVVWSEPAPEREA